MDLIKVAGKLVDTDRNQHNLVAFIVKGGRILSIGFNDMNRTHPGYFNGEHDHGIHAEYDAINRYTGDRLSGSSMYVFYVRRDGSLGDSKPCENCQKIINESGIKAVYYINDGKVEKL